MLKPHALVLGAIAAMAQAPANAAEITVRGRVVTFNGAITNEAWHELEQSVRGKRIERLSITSKGGDVMAGIEFAYWVFENAIDVEVSDYCLSSCANYVFPAARRKYIVDHGIVAWHGNARHLVHTLKTAAQGVPDETLPLFEKIAEAEGAFFKRIKVDQFICWFGTLAPYQVRNGYILSAQDMAYFGLRNVRVRANYLASDLSEWNKDGEPDIVPIRLDRKGFTSLKLQAQ